MIEAIWEISNTITPYSKFLIKQYLEQSHKDIFEVNNYDSLFVIMMMCSLRMIDVFDFDFKNKRAGVGILINDKINRQKGYASEALKLLTNYC